MKFIHLEEVDSTNKWAKENLSNTDNLSLVYTSNQTAGRGRLERKWVYTGSENIYASIILKPSPEMKEVYSNLTQYLSLVIAQTIEEYGVRTNIKWPNDVQINGKKISGILAEAVFDKGNLQGLILGFGINLNCEEEIFEHINQPATSLNLEIGMKINRENFLKKLSNRFCLRYDNFIEEGFISIKEEYIKRANFLNTPLTVRVFDKEISGVAVEVTDKGGLKLKDKSNNEQILLIGDIL